MKKPAECFGCPLYEKGQGFTLPDGNAESSIVLIGEALGEEEVAIGRPFVGPAGDQLNRTLARSGIEREGLLIGNAIQCRPPNNWLSGAPWEHAALNHCRIHRQKLYSERVHTYLTLGTIATRTVLSDHGFPYEGELKNWHCTVTKVEVGQFIIPTFHPSYLLQGNQKLFNAQAFAVRLAHEIAAFGGAYQPDPMTLIVDPPPHEFNEFVLELPDPPAPAGQDQEEKWLSVDIETVSSLGTDEAEQQFSLGDITRINFSYDTQIGLTVPWENRYMPGIQTLLASPNAKILWNERFDIPILRKNDMIVNGVVFDAMQGWHFLQPNLPMGLGFTAPFYCRIGPWKHLSMTAPGRYAAIDAVATLKCAFGIAHDLIEENRWDPFHRYNITLDSQVLHPAEDIGLLIDQEEVRRLQGTLDVQLKEREAAIRAQIPESALPLDGGWKRDPGDKWPGAFKKVVEQTTTCCIECGENDVTSTHECRPTDTASQLTPPRSGMGQ
jgi:DNA polymerase